MPSDIPPSSPPPSRKAEPVPVMDPRIGSVLAERYLIRSLLGEGGMGRVYAAEHVLMHKRVAIKVLHKELTTLPDVVSRFEREAMAAANIDHPNVAAATDFGHLPDGSVFLVLEYVQGISLRSEIADGPFAVTRALHIARQIASALASAHARGIVHRDLKPENVMLVEKAGDPDFVKVLDFGIAKVPIQELTERDSARPGQIITKVGMIFGTPEYMAPEQALGQEADGRADQYALGIILFEMLTGRRPYQSGSQVGMLGQKLKGPPPTLAEVAPNIIAPDATDELIFRLLSAEREQRFDSTVELVEVLEEQLILLQPNLVIRGSRPDASAGPLTLADGPVSSRRLFRDGATSESGPTQRQAPTRERTGKGLLRAVRHGFSTLPSQLVLALVGGLIVGVGGVTTGLIVLGGHRNADSHRREAAQAARAMEPTAPAVPTLPRAPSQDFTQARAGGVVELEALARRYPGDASITVEIAKAQFATGDCFASVNSVARALAIDPRVSNDAEVATLMWKAVQKRECGDAAFKLLEGPMGTRGADILYDLSTTEGVRRDIMLRADEYFVSGRYRAASSPALMALVGLKYATNCEERARFVELAIRVGDDRFLLILEPLEERAGCGTKNLEDCNPCLRSSGVLERASEAIHQRARIR